MDRSELLEWLSEHRQEVHGDPVEIIERAEREVRRHAVEDAWRSAQAYVERRMHQWERQWGFHASEAYAAKEVCPKLAKELARHQPHPRAGDETHLAGESVLRALEPAARRVLIEWILELAEREEHHTWEQIVEYTRRRGRGLVREGRVSRDDSWEGTENYAAKAAHVADLLAQEFESHVHVRRRNA